jgi:hypothetical protein
MIITYNKYPSIQNVYAEFYWNRANQLREIILITSRGKVVHRAITMIITYNEYPSTENWCTLFYWNRADQLRITRKVLITSRGKILLTAKRFQWLPHIAIINALKIFIPSFTEIEQTNYELRENDLLTSRDKRVLTAMRF